MKLIDLTAKRFGRLAVLARGPTRKRETYWHCLCDCGQKTIVCSKNLRKGVTQSCGCRNSELARARATTHGLARTKAYRLWAQMMGRCYNPQNISYGRYGARGIRVCQRWHDVRLFLEDMGPRPMGLSVERRDNSGNYEPNNCHWGTPQEQANNTRRNRFLTVNGRTQTVAQWTREMGYVPTLILSRIDKLKWTPERAVLQPPLQTWNRRPNAA